MKKFIYMLFIGASAFFMASCMETDNFDEPGAHFTGRIIDVTTGENVPADQGECRVRIWEKSFSLNPAHQDIPVKQDGTFNNSKLFNGTYDIVPQGAWWPADTIRLGIGRKTVTENFEVTPYLKLFDFETELVGDILYMHCRMDAPKPDGMPQIMEIRPFLSLNQFCGAGNCISYYFNNAHRENIMKSWEKIEKLDDGKSRVFTLKAQVKSGYTYFVRVGAKVRDDFEKFNYTVIKEVTIP